MRVLVTGASGFLGSHVAERLAEGGASVRLLLRRTSDLSFLGDLQYERAEGDVRQPASLAAAMAGVEAVVHAAGLISARSEAEYRAVNEAGTRAVVDAALGAGVRRFVYVSSLAAQGPSPDGRVAAPDAEPRPVSPYGRSKLGGEAPVLAAGDRMSVAIVRPPAIYGPRDRAFLLFYRALKLGVMPLHGDGLNQLSWIHVRDAASAIASTVVGDGPSGSVYTIADGGVYTWNELVDLAARVLGKRPLRVRVPPLVYAAAGHAAGLIGTLIRRQLPLDPEKVREMAQRYWVCDNERITAELGWRPEISAQAGIEDTARWYRDNRWL